MKSEEIIINLLHQLRDAGKTIFVIHHDLSKVEKYFDHLILLNKRLVQSGEVANVYTPDLLQEAYEGNAAILNNGNNMMVVGP